MSNVINLNWHSEAASLDSHSGNPADGHADNHSDKNAPATVLPPALSRLLILYQRLNAGNLHELSRVYSDDVLFSDPFHELHGLPALENYFRSLYARVNRCDFTFHQIQNSEQQALVRWTLHLSHPRLAGGKLLIVPGVSELAWHERVYLHRDYFDGAQMIYNHLPVIGRVLAWVRRRM